MKQSCILVSRISNEYDALSIHCVPRPVVMQLSSHDAELKRKMGLVWLKVKANKPRASAGGGGGGD